VDGPYNPAGGKYAPAPLDANGNFNAWENSQAGGSHVTSRGIPVLRGGSYVARRLGINNLKDVP
jgi:hypothetical protein